MDEETRKKLEEWSKTAGQTPFSQKRPAPKTKDEDSEPESSPQLNPLKEARKQDLEKNDDLLSRIRTYESDAAEAVNKKKASVSSIFIAEQKAQRREGSGSENRTRSRSKGLLYAILSIILLAGGAGVLYGWYTFVYLPQNTQTEALDTTYSLVPANQGEQFLFVVEDRQALVSALESFEADLPISENEIYSIQFIEEITDAEGNIARQPITSRVFLEKLSVRAPLTIYRSLDPEFTYGIHRKADAGEPFLILKTNFYQNAFASMLGWEDFLLEDLEFMATEIENLAEEEVEEVAPIATSTEADTETATSTATEAETANIDEEPEILLFKDEVISNHDARVLRNRDEEILLLYSFADEDTLIITNNIETLLEMFRRLSLVIFE